ncbi:hypothetical protein EB796_010925 [Bugula neritina]|uniref:Uncharacterized protein n=1 Tax=Bugula neritina TaxID=10212 RepID=A0A7J7JZK6_BUGNE|nr:hypothetical protein EB796_010925 [Bugula neritina]
MMLTRHDEIDTLSKFEVSTVLILIMFYHKFIFCIFNCMLDEYCDITPLIADGRTCTNFWLILCITIMSKQGRKAEV